MALYRITDLSALSSSSIDNNTFFLVEYNGTQYKLDADTLKDYVLAGLSAGDILTTTNTKTVTKKTLNDIRINSNTIVESKSEDLNLLSGLASYGVIPNDFRKLYGLSSNIVSRLNSINGKLVSSNYQAISINIPAADFSSGSITLTASDIKNEIGVPDTLAYSFSTNLQVELWEIPASTSTQTAVDFDGYTIQINPVTTSSGQQIIKELTLDLDTVTANSTYRLCLLLQRVNAANILASVAVDNTQQSYL